MNKFPNLHIVLDDLRSKCFWSNCYKFLWLISISSTVVYGFRKFYYHIFPWVLSKNIIYPPEALTPWIAGWNTERDGIEIYVLYVFIFLIILTTTLSIFVLKFLHNRKILAVIMGCAVFCTYRLLSGVGGGGSFQALNSKTLLYCSLFGLFILGLTYIHKHSPKIIEILFICFVLLPFCFIATSPIAMSNYVYIFSPAQKLLEGVDVRNIYFQYDFFLSMIAALWMKLGLNLTQFQFLGQLSYFAAILAIFLMARNLFQNRQISFLLLIALIVVRIASAPWDPVYVFQITPLRLDLWLILFAFIYLLGPNHWILTLTCGLLILVHGNFGLIITLGYLQLIMTLGVISMVDIGLKAKLIQWGKSRNILRLIASSSFLFICFFISRSIFGESFIATSYYQKIGIGFIPMAKISLYWLIPIVVSSVFILLCNLRKVLNSKYVSLGFVLIFFLLGNSIYFFGRSHELNLFSIAIPIVFLFFFGLDLLDRSIFFYSGTSALALANKLVFVLGLSLILVVTYRCSQEISNNIALKWRGVVELQFHPGDPFKENQLQADNLLSEVYEVIASSVPIQFVIKDENLEFSLYQRVHGNSAFFYPFASWIFLDQLVKHEQVLLDKGVYLLIDKNLYYGIFEDKLRNVKFRHILRDGSHILIGSRKPVDNGMR
jgi:hypothetical protein